MSSGSYLNSLIIDSATDSLDALGLLLCCGVDSWLKAGNNCGEQEVGRTGKRMYIGSLVPWTDDISEGEQVAVCELELGHPVVGI